MVLSTLIRLLALLQKNNIYSLELSGDFIISPLFTFFWYMNATQYLHFIISSLVTHVHAIEITEEQDELGTLLTLKVDPVAM